MKTAIGVLCLAALVLYASGWPQNNSPGQQISSAGQQASDSSSQNSGSSMSFKDLDEMKSKFWDKFSKWYKRQKTGQSSPDPKEKKDDIKANDPCFQQPPQMDGDMVKLMPQCNMTETKDITLQGQQLKKSCTTLKFIIQKGSEKIKMIKKIILLFPNNLMSGSSSPSSSDQSSQSSSSSDESSNSSSSDQSTQSAQSDSSSQTPSTR